MFDGVVGSRINILEEQHGHLHLLQSLHRAVPANTSGGYPAVPSHSGSVSCSQIDPENLRPPALCVIFPIFHAVVS